MGHGIPPPHAATGTLEHPPPRTRRRRPGPPLHLRPRGFRLRHHARPQRPDRLHERPRAAQRQSRPALPARRQRQHRRRRAEPADHARGRPESPSELVPGPHQGRLRQRRPEHAAVRPLRQGPRHGVAHRAGPAGDRRRPELRPPRVVARRDPDRLRGADRRRQPEPGDQGQDDRHRGQGDRHHHERPDGAQARVEPGLGDALLRQAERGGPGQQLRHRRAARRGRNGGARAQQHRP